MRSFAPRPAAGRPPRSAKHTPPNRIPAARSRATGEHAAATRRESRFQHDFSRVPVSARRASASGERAGAPGGGREWLPITGGPPLRAGTPGGRLNPGGTLPYREATELAECIRIMGDADYCRHEVLGDPLPPYLQKSTVSGPTALNNGGFSWGVQWSLANVTSHTNGWIVQHVMVTQDIEDGAGSTVTPGQGGYDGLETSWYPIWEAWQVRNGQVFVGGTTAPHKADTYGQPPVGAGTRGTTSVVGRADFYPHLTLPASFVATHGPPAWALPVTTTDPALTGGTRALDHNLTATWDSVGGTGVTTLTTV